MKNTLKEFGREALGGVLDEFHLGQVKAHRSSRDQQLELHWGNVVKPSNIGRDYWDGSHIDSETKKQVVNELYPRLLYAFSDVVCFITTNIK